MFDFRQKGNKWGNRKVTIDGITFDSKLESERYLFLKSQQKVGKISNLQLQVKFELTRTHHEIIRTIGKKGVPLKPKLKVYELPSCYKADFVYDTVSNGLTVTIVEDTKGFKTPDYILKKKMMLDILGIPIMEIKKPCDPIPTLPELAD